MLEANGKSPIYLWSRGGYTTGMQAAKHLMRLMAGKRLPAPGQSDTRTETLKKPVVARLWLAAAILDLIRVYGIQLRWWALRGRPVLCDRYLWDTLVDFQLAFPDVPVEQSLLWRLLEKVAVAPDNAFFFELAPDEAERRSVDKGDPWPEPLEKRNHRQSLYDKQIDAGRFTVVDASQTIDAIFQELTRIMRQNENRP